MALTCAYKFLCESRFVSLGLSKQDGIAESHVCNIILKKKQLVLHSDVLFASLPAAEEDFSCSASLPTFAIVCCFVVQLLSPAPRIPVPHCLLEFARVYVH